MSFGAGLACGMGAGFGSGFASGIAAGQTSGKKQVRDEVENNLREAASRYEVTVRDRSGRSVPFDKLVSQVLPVEESSLEDKGARKVLLGLLVLGTVVLVGVTVFYVFAAS